MRQALVSPRITLPEGGSHMKHTIRLAACVAVATSVLTMAPAQAVTPPRVTVTQAQHVVSFAYEDFLDAPPSSTSLSYWSGRLAAGTSSQAAVVAHVAGSETSVAEQISRLYYSILQRVPAGTSLHARVVAVQGGHDTVAGNAEELYTSGEYLAAHGGSTSTWVAALYGAVLNRAPSASVAATRVSQAVTRGRLYVAQQVYGSLEARGDRVRALYRRLLERAPSASSLTHWESVDATRAGDVAVATGLADSAEYASLAQLRNPLLIGTPYLTSITVGQPSGVVGYEEASGGYGSRRWQVLGLPSSLTVLDHDIGVQILGDLSAAPPSGPYTVASIVTDDAGDANVVVTSLRLVAPGGAPVAPPAP